MCLLKISTLGIYFISCKIRLESKEIDQICNEKINNLLEQLTCFSSSLALASACSRLSSARRNCKTCSTINFQNIHFQSRCLFGKEERTFSSIISFSSRIISSCNYNSCHVRFMMIWFNYVSNLTKLTKLKVDILHP